MTTGDYVLRVAREAVAKRYDGSLMHQLALIVRNGNLDNDPNYPVRGAILGARAMQEAMALSVENRPCDTSPVDSHETVEVRDKVAEEPVPSGAGLDLEDAELTQFVADLLAKQAPLGAETTAVWDARLSSDAARIEWFAAEVGRLTIVHREDRQMLYATRRRAEAAEAREKAAAGLLTRFIAWAETHTPNEPGLAEIKVGLAALAPQGSEP